MSLKPKRTRIKTKVSQQPKKPTRTIQRSKNTFSMQQIAKVLDKANKDDIKLLKNHWQEVIDHAKVMIKSL